ncbi:GNAT family N-acetyltransferase [Pseudomonas protegens]|uniref:GNAT family N-acetyltransferase n=1 Tax=Pseudomonas TaxID=286 RepID=UPI0021C8CE04|nr:GNAT family N-acetyltransferase [Pseudomonas protegens]MCU1769955.1 GNAT family N-acetyltransferase [Pseudomonas protegens]
MTSNQQAPGAGRVIRVAGPDDVPAMLECDTYARAHASRGDAVRVAVGRGQGWVEVAAGRVAGYLLLNHDFFDHGFVSLVVVAPGQQRQGVARRLLGAAERACRTPRLFISTNQSNLAARSLIAKAGFQPSGVIENLDEQDPELIFCKRVG